MADIDEKRFTIIKVIPLKEGSVTVAYSNYACDKRWHLLYENQSKTFDNFSQIFEYCNARFMNPFGGVLWRRCYDICDKNGQKESTTEGGG